MKAKNAIAHLGLNNDVRNPPRVQKVSSKLSTINKMKTLNPKKILAKTTAFTIMADVHKHIHDLSCNDTRPKV